MLSLQKNCIHESGKGRSVVADVCSAGGSSNCSVSTTEDSRVVSELSFVEWILLHSSLLFPECQGNEINHCTAISSREAGLVSSTSEHIHSVSVSVCMFLFYIFLCCFV